jgi:manganese transport protein
LLLHISNSKCRSKFFYLKNFPYAKYLAKTNHEVIIMSENIKKLPLAVEEGWRNKRTQPTLPEVYRSLRIPKSGSWMKKFLAFAGPGYLVAVGYMDPGNWATDIAGGSQFGYTLLSVILLSI